MKKWVTNMRTLLDDVFDDLIKDLEKYGNKSNKEMKIKKLEDIREDLEDKIAQVDDELKYLKQDDNFVGVDETIEEMRINGV